MSGFTRRFGVTQVLLALAAAPAASGQTKNSRSDDLPEDPNEARLPNGKLQRDEILKADYQQNLKDSRDLVDLARSFELDLEKSDRFVLSIGLLKKLDDIEKLTKRIRGRMKK